MHIILLSGGSGKRLWPLSNDIRSKQFIKLFETEHGIRESMLQRVYRQIKEEIPDSEITVATEKKQVSAIKNQLGDKINICVEPERRDTFPAIALAVSYLQDVKQVGIEESVLVCPVDPYVEYGYFKYLRKLVEYANEGEKGNLFLLGVDPTYPSQKYGYIIPETMDVYSNVRMFKEKPTAEEAKVYISEGAMWNSGAFVFKVDYLMKKAHEHMQFHDYHNLYHNYEKCSSISFDYAVVEQETSIQVMRFSGKWKDIGTWNTFTESMSESVIGKAVLDSSCQNTHVINELNIPILGMGLKGLVVAASGDGILISDKEQSSFIKSYVDQFHQHVMFAEKSWGSFTVLDI